jgi:hypothetical protein
MVMSDNCYDGDGSDVSDIGVNGAKHIKKLEKDLPVNIMPIITLNCKYIKLYMFFIK